MGSPDWHVTPLNHHLRRLLWKCCPWRTEITGNGRADRLAGKTTITGGWSPEDLQSKGHHSIDPLNDCGKQRTLFHRSSGGLGNAKEITPSISWRTAWGKDAPDNLLCRTRRGHCQSDQHWDCFKDIIGKHLRRGKVCNYGLSPAR